MNRIVHFEIPVDDPEKAMAFYRDVLGWQFTLWPGPDPYWLVTTGPDGQGINGGLMKKRHPDQPVVNTVDVADIDAMLKTVDQHRGTCVVPKVAIPGVGWLAYCKDPEGTIFGMMQNDPGAK